jgi:Holliday junction resolvasome RuvABC ATP-dependent DNA helicase subunit
MLNDATRAAFGADLVGQRARLAQEAGVRDQGQAIATPKPVGAADRTRNPLRPRTFDEVVGQDDAKRMLRRVVNQARLTGQPLDHTLLVGPSGTGKSTFSNVIANELGVEVYEVEAPVSHETLLALRTAMSDRDILRIEEIHQQAIMERRGRGAATEPEVLYNVLGTTTDEGLLPDPFLNRFPLRPRLERYSREQLVDIGGYNAQALGMKAEREALELFADAGRGIPRQINNYVRNAKSLDSGEGIIHLSLAEEVVFDLNGVTRDGLTPDMAAMLVFIYEKGKRTTAQGETYYQASVGSVAVGIGKSRDVKAITLRVEGYLIEQGWLQVTHGGRRLTDAGIERARQLCGS